jgi:hypothetical protein
MRTPSQRADARREIMAGVNDHDTTLCEALMELATTIDEASQRIADAHRETARAIDAMTDDVGKQLKQTTLVR